MDTTTAAAGRTRHSILCTAVRPQRVEWYLNASRYRALLSQEQQTLLASGSTANEALNSELGGGWFGNITSVHRP
eukprot:2323252-Karenia_brevis.AAC.1